MVILLYINIINIIMIVIYLYCNYVILNNNTTFISSSNKLNGINYIKEWIKM